jgi:predicted metal-dependent peptidase
VKAKFPEVELTSQQARMWSETLAAVNWIAPGFTHILYSLLNKRGDSQVACFTEAIPCAAATDGAQLLFKPSQFFKLTLMERVFAVCHEISHCVADHCGMGYQMKKRGEIVMGNKKLEYDPMHANIVQDYIINDMLIDAKFGTFNKNWLHDTNIATFKDDWVEVYFKTYKKRKKPPGGGGKPCEDGQTPVGPGQFDQHLDPGTSEDKSPEDAEPRNPQEWQQAVAESLAVARAQGKCPASFEMFFGEMLEPKVDWRDHIKSLIARKVGSGGYDFRRPDRRLIVRDIVAPGRSGHGAGLVVIGMDSSVSIYSDPTLIDRWLGELTGIMEEVRPREVRVVWCDAKVQRVDELTHSGDIDEVRYKGAKGGGGTSFVPVFKYVEEEDLNPDCLLILTDGNGEFPSEAPRYAVIFGDISGNPGKYPFGEVVEVPTE